MSDIIKNIDYREFLEEVLEEIQKARCLKNEQTIVHFAVKKIELKHDRHRK